jgi:hypothetical protein
VLREQRLELAKPRVGPANGAPTARSWAPSAGLPGRRTLAIGFGGITTALLVMAALGGSSSRTVPVPRREEAGTAAVGRPGTAAPVTPGYALVVNAIDGALVRSGGGCILETQGLAVTSAAAVGSAEIVKVTLADRRVLPAAVVAVERSAGLALLRLPHGIYTAVTPKAGSAGDLLDPRASLAQGTWFGGVFVGARDARCTGPGD